MICLCLQILYITEPDNWSAAAIYQATRIFASNLNAKMAQRFYNLVVLPRIRNYAHTHIIHYCALLMFLIWF